MNCLCSHDLVSCPCYFQLATKEPSSTDSFQISVFDMMLVNQFVFVYQAWTENLQPKSSAGPETDLTSDNSNNLFGH